MMSLTSSRPKSADAYGTFHADEADRAALRSSAPPSPSHAHSSPRSTSLLLRGVALAGVLLLAVGLLSANHSPLSRDDTLSASASAPSTTDYEQRFLDGISTDKLREYLHAYASEPHSAGSQMDYKTAVYTARMFESFGIRAEIKPYYPLLSAPVRQRVAIVSPPSAARELNLTEASVAGDACTTSEEALPPFLAYTASGNVTGAVVYVNYGRQADYAWLAAQGVDLKGKIALVRYGQIFRGLKLMLAEQYGMAGVLIFSDPMDDGFNVGPTYPDGLWRPADSFQRGSAQFLSLYGGDPLTPGFPSTLDAAYLSVEEATNIPHIPGTVLSYAQATHVLQALSGKKAPADWQGGLSLDGGYRLGDDGATAINMDMEMDNSIAPIWDVIGTIDGAVEPDQRVLIGNHRDAWVCGAVDPSSGSAAMLELARNLGELLADGWKPRRTIQLASWDGEEFGLLGSAEYAEDRKDELLAGAVAYLNVDAVLGPMISAGGTPSIASFLRDTAKSVPANDFGGNATGTAKYESLFEQWTAQAAVARAKNGAAVEKMTLAPDHLITLLGSGTDFTAFYQHLGIISANLASGPDAGAGTYGTYHSTMDSPMYLDKYADPHYTTQATIAKWWGLQTMRLASLPVLPFDYSTYAVVMHKDLTYLEEETEARGLAIDYAALRDAINSFLVNAELFHARLTAFTASYSSLAAKGEATTTSDGVDVATAWNQKLVRLERQFIAENGLPHRAWFRHVIFGPGFYEGYAGAAFPGIADAIAFDDDAETLQAHVDDVAAIVHAAATFVLE